MHGCMRGSEDGPESMFSGRSQIASFNSAGPPLSTYAHEEPLKLSTMIPVRSGPVQIPE